jgi:hypothetical protein
MVLADEFASGRIGVVDKRSVLRCCNGVSLASSVDWVSVFCGVWCVACGGCLNNNQPSCFFLKIRVWLKEVGATEHEQRAYCIRWATCRGKGSLD